MPFVISAWADSYRLSHAAGMVPMPLYDKAYREFISWVLARSGVKLIVACHPDSTSDLYGFAAAESDVTVPRRTREGGRWVQRMEPAGMPLLQYVYVKQAYRRLGIGRGLVIAAGVNPDAPFLMACKTPVVTQCRLFERGSWSPLTVRYPKE
jgi:GNAT superfamily N-acetyltransferase